MLERERRGSDSDDDGDGSTRGRRAERAAHAALVQQKRDKKRIAAGASRTPVDRVRKRNKGEAKHGEFEARTQRMIELNTRRDPLMGPGPSTKC